MGMWIATNFLAGAMDKVALKQLVVLTFASDGVPIIGGLDDAIFLAKLNAVLEPATDIAQSGKNVLRAMVEDYDEAAASSSDLFADVALIGPAKKFLQKMMAFSQKTPESSSVALKTIERTVHLKKSVEHVQDIVQKNPSLLRLSVTLSFFAL